jgi:hypothetical protein
MISEDAVADGLTMIRIFIADWDPHPTFFEVITALALNILANQKFDVAILETGLGGRLDATNAVQSDVSVITPIALDHESGSDTHWLRSPVKKQELSNRSSGRFRAAATASRRSHSRASC